MYKNRKGIFTVKSIMCKSDIVGTDGTSPKNSPAIDTSRKLICAPGWKVLQENNEESFEQKIVGKV